MAVPTKRDLRIARGVAGAYSHLMTVALLDGDEDGLGQLRALVRADRTMPDAFKAILLGIGGCDKCGHPQGSCGGQFVDRESPPEGACP